MKKITKNLLICAVIFMLPLLSLLFTGCNENPNNEDNKITLTFATDFGELSFYSKEFMLDNEGQVYITIEDCPVISNEGDTKLFDCWTLTNGENVDFNSAFTEDSLIKAKFKNASMVAKAKWAVNQSVLSKSYSIHSIALLGATKIAGSSNEITFEKVADDEVQNNNYVTKDQIESTYAMACFVTSSENISFIKSSDLTIDTYRLEVYIVISPNDTTVRSVGYFDYVPHGVQSVGNQSSIGMLAARYNYGSMPTSSQLVNVISTTYLGQNTQLANDQSTITSIRNYASLSLGGDETWDNYDHYFVFIEVDGYKFSIKQINDQETYYYTLPNDGRLRECTKDVYDSVSY